VSADYRWIRYRECDDGEIVIITLARPQQRNAQSRGLLAELDAAFSAAEADDTVRVIILQGEGACFSAGHDLGSDQDRMERQPGSHQHPSYRTHGGSLQAAEQRWRQEWHFFFTNTRRWRDLRKITIASVHGQVLSAGLMLMWACDLIVADEDTVFADVVGTRLGMCGMEYFAHPWEFGARKTKELLLTGDSITADEAYRIGMVSKVFDPPRRQADTLEFARRIARVPTGTALMIKESVNQTLDNQGFYNSLQAAFSLHTLNHTHWGLITQGAAMIQQPELGAQPWRTAQLRPAQRSSP
jgi:enoyl-CoA hydratase/carnithine racemase